MSESKRYAGLPLAPSEDLDDLNDEAQANAGLSWEEEVLCRIAPLLAEVRRRAAQDANVLGWEAAGVQRLVQVTSGDY